MQLFVILNGESLALPINYRPLVHGMIYNTLSALPAYSEYLHNLQRTQRGRPFKGFTFSRLTGKYTMDGHRILFCDEIKLEIRSCEDAFIELLRQGIAASDSLRLGKESVPVKDCRVGDTRLLLEEAHIRMVSPAVAYRTLENRNTVFFQPDDRQFYQSLETNARRKWRFHHGDAPCDISVSPLFQGLPKKQFSTFKGTYITGWFGDYRLKGTPELLDLLYQTGLGSKNPEGFGLFSVMP